MTMRIINKCLLNIIDINIGSWTEKIQVILNSLYKIISQARGNLKKSITKEILQSYRQAKLLYYELLSLNNSFIPLNFLVWFLTRKISTQTDVILFFLH